LVAKVNGGGIVTGVTAGFITISATFSGGVGTQVVAVLQPRTAANRELAFLREHQRPDGARIQSLWLMQPNGSGQIFISTDSEFVNDFDWSWDGSKLLLAYVTFNGIGRTGTFVVNADGTVERTASPSVGAPRWSPDGTRIAYHSTPGSPDIYTVNPDGTGVRRLTFDGLSADPVWSPDGRQIAFQHGGAIGIMHADGSVLRVDTMPVSASTLFWSPDGKHIAFGAFAPDSREWLVNSDGTNPAPICYTFGCGASEFDWPPWSPDESHLVLQTAGGVEIIRAQDSTATFIAGAVTPRWSPDGSLVAFVSPADTAPAFPWIRTVHADGTFPLVLTGNDTTNTRFPVWRP
jgi:Tol biopolymer transport system component